MSSAPPRTITVVALGDAALSHTIVYRWGTGEHLGSIPPEQRRRHLPEHRFRKFYESEGVVVELSCEVQDGWAAHADAVLLCLSPTFGLNSLTRQDDFEEVREVRQQHTQCAAPSLRCRELYARALRSGYDAVADRRARADLASRTRTMPND